MLKPEQIIRAWKDASYRRSLSDAERAELPANPAGAINLSDAQLEEVAGAGTVLTKSSACQSITKTAICDFTKTCSDITKGCTIYYP